MSKRIPIEVGEYYHLYNRGVDKCDLYLDKHDHLRFVALLYICNGNLDVDIFNYITKKEGPTFFDIFNEERGDTLVHIGAYCLMPNHFHLLIREKAAGGTSTFMQKVSTAYAMYFNKRYERTGALFEGRYKAKHVDSDNYLKYLYAYIHLNPVKLINHEWKSSPSLDVNMIKLHLDSYEFSSYPHYTGVQALQRGILDTQAFPEYFESPSAFLNMITYWLTYKDIEN